MTDIVFYSEPDAGYIAYLEKLPNISAFGETEETALKELQEVKRMYIEILEEDMNNGQSV